jgi:hypothetical protein
MRKFAVPLVLVLILMGCAAPERQKGMDEGKRKREERIQNEEERRKISGERYLKKIEIERSEKLILESLDPLTRDYQHYIILESSKKINIKSDVPDSSVINTSHYSYLSPGYYSVVLGPYSSREEAEEKLTEVRDEYSTAYIQEAGLYLNHPGMFAEKLVDDSIDWDRIGGTGRDVGVKREFLYSDDFSKVAYVVREEQGDRVFINNKAYSKFYEGIKPLSLTFSPDEDVIFFVAYKTVDGVYKTLVGSHIEESMVFDTSYSPEDTFIKNDFYEVSGSTIDDMAFILYTDRRLKGKFYESTRYLVKGDTKTLITQPWQETQKFTDSVFQSKNWNKWVDQQSFPIVSADGKYSLYERKPCEVSPSSSALCHHYKSYIEINGKAGKQRYEGMANVGFNEDETGVIFTIHDHEHQNIWRIEIDIETFMNSNI